MGTMSRELLTLLALSERRSVECCEFCDEPLLNQRIYADPETVDAGLGVALCTRPACIQERESMPLRERLSVYLGHKAL